MPDHHEEDHLRSLRRDFPATPSLSTQDALKIIHSRFDSLDADAFAQVMGCVNIDVFTRAFFVLPLVIHQYLLNGIVSNANEYRQGDDPNQGTVYFGTGQRFTGYPPEKIHQGVQDATSCLVIDEEGAIKNAAMFYQQFVMVHPFYDLNGRIGRFIVDVYLCFFGKSISWKDLCANKKWLNKLNACHKRFGNVLYDDYIYRMARHWERYVFVSEE